jgi:hypothetical protein
MTDLAPTARYMQKTLGSTVHYLINWRRPMAYGNLAPKCGLNIQGVTAIQHIPHGAKVCQRCVKIASAEWMAQREAEKSASV